MSFPLKTISGYSTGGTTSQAGGIPLLNTAGYLDPTLLNAQQNGGSVADAIPQLNASGILNASLFGGVSLGGLANAKQGQVPLLNASAVLDASFLPALWAGGGSNTYFDIGGWRFLIGTGTIPASGTHIGQAAITFPSNLQFAGTYIVIPVANTVNIVNNNSYAPILSIIAQNATGFTAYYDINDPTSTPGVDVAVNFTWLAIGQVPAGQT